MIKRFVLCAACLFLLSASFASSGIPRDRELEFTYTAKLGELPAGAHRVDLWLPYPVSDEHQDVTVTSVTAPYPHEVLKESKYGNSILHITATDPKEKEIAVEMKIQVRRKEYLHNDFAKRTAGKMPAEVEQWLKPDRLVPLDDYVRKIACEVTAGKTDDLAKERAIYDYVVSTMSYDKSGTGWGNGDIKWACDAKRGNCTDFHALFIGLSRAVGIPAKFAIGFPLPPERGQGEVPGYHCWAEFYLAGYGWVPVDASEARKHPEKKDYFFGAHDENRVQFSIGRDITLNPRQKGNALNYFIYPYAEIDGQPYAKVSKAFAFKDSTAKTAAAGGPQR